MFNPTVLQVKRNIFNHLFPLTKEAIASQTRKAHRQYQRRSSLKMSKSPHLNHIGKRASVGMFLQPLGTGSPGDLFAQTSWLRLSCTRALTPYTHLPPFRRSVSCGPVHSDTGCSTPSTNPRAITPVHTVQAPCACALESCFLQTTSSPGNASKPSPVG